MNKNLNEPTLTQLINDLDSTIKTQTARYIILNLQLHAEHYVNEIVGELVKEPARDIVKTDLTFKRKLKILEDMGVLNDQMKQILLKLSSIRNTMMHNLLIDEKDIQESLAKCDFGITYSWRFKCDNLDEKHSVNFKKIYKDFPDKFVQLQISVVAIVGILFTRLKELEGNFPNQFIKFLPRKGENYWLMDMKVFEAQKVEKESTSS